jgi:hypothetical protein
MVVSRHLGPLAWSLRYSASTKTGQGIIEEKVTADYAEGSDIARNFIRVVRDIRGSFISHAPAHPGHCCVKWFGLVLAKSEKR